MARTHALFPTLIPILGAVALASALGLSACSKSDTPPNTASGISQEDASKIPGNTGLAYDAKTGNTVPAEATSYGFNQSGSSGDGGNAVGGAAGGTTRSVPPTSTEPASRFAGKPTRPSRTEPDPARLPGGEGGS